MAPDNSLKALTDFMQEAAVGLAGETVEVSFGRRPRYSANMCFVTLRSGQTVLLRNGRWIGSNAPPSFEATLRMSEMPLVAAWASMDSVHQCMVEIELFAEADVHPHIRFEWLVRWRDISNGSLFSFVGKEDDHGLFPRKSFVAQKAELLLKIARQNEVVQRGTEAGKRMANLQGQLAMLEENEEKNP